MRQFAETKSDFLHFGICNSSNEWIDCNVRQRRDSANIYIDRVNRIANVNKYFLPFFFFSSRSRFLYLLKNRQLKTFKYLKIFAESRWQYQFVNWVNVTCVNVKQMCVYCFCHCQRLTENCIDVTLTFSWHAIQSLQHYSMFFFFLLSMNFSKWTLQFNGRHICVRHLLSMCVLFL